MPSIIYSLSGWLEKGTNSSIKLSNPSTYYAKLKLHFTQSAMNVTPSTCTLCFFSPIQRIHTLELFPSEFIYVAVIL